MVFDFVQLSRTAVSQDGLDFWRNVGLGGLVRKLGGFGALAALSCEFGCIRADGCCLRDSVTCIEIDVSGNPSVEPKLRKTIIVGFGSR